MAEAARVRLGEVVDLLAGYPFKSERFSSRESDIALVKGENVLQGYIDWEIAKRWPADEWDTLVKFHLAVDDVVVAMDRPWVPAGLKWASIRHKAPRALLVQRCARLRSSSPRLDQRFLRFLIGGSGFESYVRPITTGVNVPHISGKQILDFECWLPSPDTQRRIASILSAYDDLIENCQRRIRILEDMARGLYREWFVHFRFAGADSLPRVDSPLGPIPPGWKVRPLRELVAVNRRQLSVRSAPEDIHYIDIASVSPGSIDAVTPCRFSDAPGRARRVVQHGDVLWSCVRPNRRSHALVMSPAADTIASTGFAVLSPIHVPYAYLYNATTTDDFVAYLTNHATGAAYPAVTAKTFEDAALVLPDGGLLEDYASAAEPMYEMVHGLRLKITNLRRTRDLLLPRLISGQIDLRAAEDAMPA